MKIPAPFVPGNTIKTSAGNNACDTACDGEKTVPNEVHTACGEILNDLSLLAIHDKTSCEDVMTYCDL